MAQPSNYNTYLLDKNGKRTGDIKKGDLYISVSTVLGMESKGNLVDWALSKFGKEQEPYKAYKAWMEEVKNTGTAIHKFVECDLKGEELPSDFDVKAIEKAIIAWDEFRSKNKIEVVASERIAFSRKWRCAGQCDLVMKLNDKLYVADFKTGSVNPSAFTQMAAYKAMFCQDPKGSRIEGIEDADLLVINLHRDGGPVKCFDIGTYYNERVTIQDELHNFHCLRHLWYFRNVKGKKDFQPIIKNMDDVIGPLENRFRKAFKLN